MKAWAVAVLVAALVGCDRHRRAPSAIDGARPARAPTSVYDRQQPAGSAKPAASPRSDRPWVKFTDVTAGSGLESFRLHAGTETPKYWIVDVVGGGICAADFDRDGDVDLVLVDGASMSLEGEVEDVPGGGSRLYRNEGGFRFTDATGGAGLPSKGYFLGAAAADWDGDGATDLCMVGYDAAALLRNRGDGTFEDVTESAGFELPRHFTASSCAWADLDRDGRLDLYVAGYMDVRHVVELIRRTSPGSPLACRVRDVPALCVPRTFPGLPDRLFLQRSSGEFSDASERIGAPPRSAFQPIVSDLDGDGDLDLYVPNDDFENTVLENDGQGRFADRGVECGAATSRDLEVQGSMGVAVADYDQDGRMDVAVTNFDTEYNALYRNRTRAGNPLLFEDVSAKSGFCRAPHDRVCWGVGLVDFDHDGVHDAFIAAGQVYVGAELEAAIGRPSRQLNQVLRGLGAPKFEFEDVSQRSGPHFADARLWRGAVFPDLDGDGDPDVVVSALHSAPAVLRNDGGEAGAWVRFDLRPRKGAPTAAGARVTITLPGGARRIAELQCGSSFASSDDPRVHFGLGSAETLPRVEVRWPDGTQTVLTDVRTRCVVPVHQDPADGRSGADAARARPVDSSR